MFFGMVLCIDVAAAVYRYNFVTWLPLRVSDLFSDVGIALTSIAGTRTGRHTLVSLERHLSKYKKHLSKK